MISIDAYGIHIASLYIRFYAIILITGMSMAAWLSAQRTKALSLHEDIIWDGLLWAIIPGIIGARLYHVFTPQPSAVAWDGSPLTTAWYLQHPQEIFALWNGGLGIYGALVGGALGIYVYCRLKGLPLFLLLDIVVPTMALGQAIGRWGNFVNHELYGAPTTLPWAISIPIQARIKGYEAFETFHPLFLYESLWNFGAFLLLLWIERRMKTWLRRGDLTLIYLMSYAIIRFILDFVRLDSNGFGVITTAQIVSLVAFGASLLTLIIRHRLPRAPEAPLPTAYLTEAAKPASKKSSSKSSKSATKSAK